jgi:O-antigen/teichoic acid export membrane protein
MQKKFLSSLGLIVLLNLLVKPLYILGIDAEVQNRVGQEAYGTYFALLNLSFIFNILIDLGINNFNNRNIAQNEQLIGKHFSKLFSIKALLAMVYAGVTLGLGLVLGYREISLWMLGIMVFNQVLVSFILFTRSNLAALHMFGKDSVVSVLDRALLIIFCGILLFTQITDGRFEILWFVYLQTIAYGTTLLTALVMVGNKSGKLRWNFDRIFSLHIFKKSAPYALFILSVSMYNRVDGIMLENLRVDGSLQAGHYAQGYRFYEAAGMFAMLFAVLLLPIFSRMLKQGESTRSLLEISSRLLIGLSTMAAIFLFFNGDLLLEWRYVDVDESAVWSFMTLMIGFVGVCMLYIYGTLLTANGNLRELNYISLGGLGLNLILNFILIPSYGAFGAAITTMLTQVLTGVLQMAYVARSFRLGINYMMLGQFAVFTAAFIGVHLILEEWIASDLSRFLIGMFSGLVLLLLTQVVRVRQIKDFISAGY